MQTCASKESFRGLALDGVVSSCLICFKAICDKRKQLWNYLFLNDSRTSSIDKIHGKKKNSTKKGNSSQPVKK